MTEFNVIRFTPDPEAIEPANVAILLKERPPRLIFDPAFQRLECLAPSFGTKNLLLWLEEMRDIVREPSALGARPEDVVRRSSAQFSVSEAKSLGGHVSAEVERLLVQRYLRRQARSHERVERATREQRVEAKLHDYLVRTFRVPESRILRRASPVDFLGPQAVAELRGNGFTCHRVINGTRNIVVVNGLSLAGGTWKVVTSQAERIAFAVYRLGQIKEFVERVEKRTLSRATVVFGSVPSESPHAPHYEFARDLAGRECEHILDGVSGDAKFQACVRDADPHLSY